MNKLNWFAIVITAAVIIQACGRNANTDDTSLVDSVTVVKNTPGHQRFEAEKVDADFIGEAIRFNRMGLELGEIARRQGIHKRIKTFGMVLIADQSKLNKKIKALSLIKNIAVPAEPEASGSVILSQLSKKSGADFDRAYISIINNEYKKEIPIFEAAEKNCADKDIKSFAMKTMPMLKAHLEAINAISYSMK
ncbi:DUF4142 domain-containing protein [Mucilaginibacter xinganensis]|uniref:DUF4142 domain-containing protein n=1 Tax=Mucilaginibacter xinganensis TaxID=1234841 RepID=A0A223P2Y1_9SPHI|nr:DUF4142 domain-containing protein [Mucilaginibacter xinganensis]ASU36465.1 hypothetical protein MuYL_4580 [Mucilaginibacter xinganensis]